MRNVIKTIAITSTLLLITFTIVLITGIGLKLAPEHAMRGWSFLGLHKRQLEKIHTLSGFIMSGIVFVHFFINNSMFVTELKSLKKKK